MRPRGATFAIVANGFADGPAQALRDYLIDRGGRVVTIFHPLTPEQGSTHTIAVYANRRLVSVRAVRAPLRPPLSFALDPVVPLHPPQVDVWFGFNPLACARGLVARRRRRTGTVVLWSVDFVPDRFGRGTLLTRFYDHVDRLCCTYADTRVELSEAAREARNRRHRLPPDAAQAHVVPMGAWLDRVSTVPEDGFRARRIVFLGHLVPRQGVDVLLEALALLSARDVEVTADIVGTGPLEPALRRKAQALGLGDIVRFHGFVPDHQDVERILAGSSLAVAPYRPGSDTFTTYADPGKLKAYLAAGLPILLTDIPPNAGELAREAGAEVVPYSPAAVADALAAGLASPERWRERRNAAIAYSQRFDWNRLFDELLGKLAL